MPRATRVTHLTDEMVLRTVYLDADLDDQLRQLAMSRKLSKAQLFREYLLDGIRAAKADPALIDKAAERDSKEPLLLRTIYLDPKVDHRLLVQAFDSRTTRNDLLRRYVRVGLRIR